MYMKAGTRKFFREDNHHMINPKHWHPSITPELLQAAGERRMFDLDNPGFCISCGHEQDGCEPDARRYRCESCGDRQVYGAEELLISMVLP